MADFNISQFTQKVQDFINENKIDKNGDKKINEANGELASLLSGMGAESAEELLMSDSVQLGNTKPTQETSMSGSTPMSMPEGLESIINDLGPTHDMLDILKNIAEAIDKYKTLTPDEQQTVRENTITGLEEKWNELYSNYSLVETVQPLTFQLVGLINSLQNDAAGLTADVLEETLSKTTSNVAESVEAEISRSNDNFKKYDFMYKDQYVYNDKSQVPMEGGNPSLTKVIIEAGDKFKQQVLEEFAAGTLDEQALMTAMNDYQKIVKYVNSQIKEITDELLEKYQQEFIHDVDALENNTQNADQIPAMNGTAGLAAFADAVNNYENSGIESLQAEPNNSEPKKYIENGRVVIERNGEKYDAGSGRRIE